MTHDEAVQTDIEVGSAYSKTYRNYAPDWWTPENWWAWVCCTLGVERSEVFDPCPPRFVERVHRSGLEVPWGDETYCNHPGGRGNWKKWWNKYLAEQERQRGLMSFVWCAFSIEQLRHLRPSPFHMPGWLILPRTRTDFIWGGPDMIVAKRKGEPVWRYHGKPSGSPGNWAVWWTNCEPATPPVESIVVRTS